MTGDFHFLSASVLFWLDDGPLGPVSGRRGPSHCSTSQQTLVTQLFPLHLQVWCLPMLLIPECLNNPCGSFNSAPTSVDWKVSSKIPTFSAVSCWEPDWYMSIFLPTLLILSSFTSLYFFYFSLFILSLWFCLHCFWLSKFGTFLLNLFIDIFILSFFYWINLA